VKPACSQMGRAPDQFNPDAGLARAALDAAESAHDLALAAGDLPGAMAVAIRACGDDIAGTWSTAPPASRSSHSS